MNFIDSSLMNSAAGLPEIDAKSQAAHPDTVTMKSKSICSDIFSMFQCRREKPKQLAKQNVTLTPGSSVERALTPNGVFSTMHQYLGFDAYKLEMVNKYCRQMTTQSWKTEFTRLNLVALELIDPNRGEFEKEKNAVLAAIKITNPERFKIRILENYVYKHVNETLGMHYYSPELQTVYQRLVTESIFSCGKLRCEKDLYTKIFMQMRSAEMNAPLRHLLFTSLRPDTTPEKRSLAMSVSLRLLRDGVAAPKNATPLSVPSTTTLVKVLKNLSKIYCTLFAPQRKPWGEVLSDIIDHGWQIEQTSKQGLTEVNKEFIKSVFAEFLKQEPNVANQHTILEKILLGRLFRCPRIVLEQISLSGINLSNILNQVFIDDEEGYLQLDDLCKDSVQILTRHFNEAERNELCKRLHKKNSGDPNIKYYIQVLHQWMLEASKYSEGMAAIKKEIVPAGEVRNVTLVLGADEKEDVRGISHPRHPIYPDQLD